MLRQSVSALILALSASTSWGCRLAGDGHTVLEKDATGEWQMSGEIPSMRLRAGLRYQGVDAPR